MTISKMERVELR